MKNKKQKAESTLREKILELIQHEQGAISFKRLKKNLAEKFSKTEIWETVHQLVSEGVMEQRGSNYSLHRKKPEQPKRTHESNLLTGKVQLTQSGSGWLTGIENADDLRIEFHHLHGAMDGDLVKARLVTRGKKISAEVMEVVERKKEIFSGTIRKKSGSIFLITENEKSETRIVVAPQFLNGAKEGDKAAVKITHWPTRSQQLAGEVVKVFGKAGTDRAETDSLLTDAGFRLEFPKTVLQESQNLPDEIPADEIQKRRDFRNVCTLTIDPDDAKDFDDAISFRELPEGKFEVGVHIADVSHYVKPGSALDKEAILRATSVYLVGEVLPMFPERLSNELCSLRPNEDKLSFAAVFKMDANAKIHEAWYGRTVVHSQKRFTYEEAQKIIEGGEGKFSAELRKLHSLAQHLRTQRVKNGSINFETTEVKFKLNADGTPAGVVMKEQKESNKLVEDFMLLANRSVAEFIGKKKPGIKTPAMVYRIHDLPDNEKLEDFHRIAQSFGYKLHLETPKQIAQSLNELFKKIHGKPEQEMLETLAIRCMAKAIYTIANKGHYGLGFEYYTHFTSPIRRYPDVLTHRVLAEYLNEINPQEKIKKKKLYADAELEKLCKHSSDMERSAMECERESIKMKQVEYMTQFIGEKQTGVISGVMRFGFFVEMDLSKAEGMVRADTMTDDDYFFDEKNHRFVGRRLKNEFRLGQKVTVTVLKCDRRRRQIDLEIAE